jgi:serine/threonine protein kinase
MSSSAPSRQDFVATSGFSLTPPSVLDYTSPTRWRPLDVTSKPRVCSDPSGLLVTFSRMKHCTICNIKFDDSVSFCPTDGEVLEDDPSSLVNTVLDGQYQMEDLLGKGGMGAVYRARHILLGDRVAIKVLPPEVRNNAEWLRRFRREGQAARRFRHPNAVTVYDLRTAGDGTIYMVMEYVEGHTLDAELKKRGTFSPYDAVELLTPIMSVLDTAHSMGVVHRDLKPENIMVGNAGSDGVPVIKLLDLGIAKISEIAGVDTGGNTALTMAGQVLGTPYYMSPEQWGEIPRDGNVEIDGRADIYSLGLVFYEMVAGRRCYQGATLHELRREHISVDPRPLLDVVANVPRAFSETIQRATAKDRSERQATASELATELKASVAGTGESSSPGIAAQQGLSAATIGVGKVATSSDVTAPTIVEMNPTPTFDRPSTTNPPPLASPVQQPVAPPVAPPTPPIVPAGVESKTIASVLTVPRVGAGAEAVTPAPKSSKTGLLIALGGLLIVGLIGAGIAGFFIFKGSNEKANTNSNSQQVVTPVAPREVAKYWLELEANSGQVTKVAGLVPLASGQSFKMHFVFEEDGYVYLIGPAKHNQPTAFLTSKPSEGTGLESNQTTKQADFSFPSGATNWLTLDLNPGTENWTVIFSKKPLSAGFLNGAVTGEPLTSEEQEEMKQFVSKYKGTDAKTDLDESNQEAPVVRIKSTKSGDEPLVFDIRIQHN